MDSIDKRNSVKKDYNLIADQYFEEFGTILEDVDLINKFESYLEKDASIIDLGGGSGKLTNYFNEKLFCFSLQLGKGEEFVDEPYLKENGKNV